MKIFQLLLLMIILLLSLFMDIIEGSKHYDRKSRKKNKRRPSKKQKKSSYYGDKYYSPPPPYYDQKQCEFGRGKFKRDFDTLDTDDCTCNNFLVQYKLAQIATDYNFHVGIISANRNPENTQLRAKGESAFRKFSRNFIDDDQVYITALFENANTDGSGSLTWNTLDEFLNTGGADSGDQSIVTLLLDQDTTLIYTNPNWIITDCTEEYIDGKLVEITTLKSLFTLYRRPDDENQSDVLQRQFETLKFIRREYGNSYRYLIFFQEFKGTRFSLDNQSNMRDTAFSTFDHQLSTRVY